MCVQSESFAGKDKIIWFKNFKQNNEPKKIAQQKITDDKTQKN